MPSVDCEGRHSNPSNDPTASVRTAREAPTSDPPARTGDRGGPLRVAVDLSALLSNLVHETVHLWDQPVSTTPPAPKPPVRALQRQVRLSDEHIADLIARHEAGLSVRRLSVAFGINRETVLEHLKRAGVPRRPNVRKLTDEQVASAAELYASNLSLVKVATHFNVNAATIRREFALAGVPVRARRGWENR